jgi:hypothetical protein
MDITITWGNQQHTVILITCGNDWTWEDFQAADRAMLEMLNSSERRVDFILDLSEGQLPPNLVEQFPALTRTAGVTHANAGRIALVGSQSTPGMVWDLFERAYPTVAAKVILCGTVEQAYMLLGAMSTTIMGADQ